MSSVDPWMSRSDLLQLANHRAIVQEIEMEEINAKERRSKDDRFSIEGIIMNTKDRKSRTLNFSYSINLVEDAHLKMINTIPGLRDLSLFYGKITDNGILYLDELFSLIRLDLQGCDQITDVSLRHISHLKLIEILNLQDCSKTTDAGISALKSLTRLRDLSLYGCNRTTDIALGHIACLTKLEILNLSFCSKITDTGIEQLKVLIRLKQLYLTGCDQITDKGVAHFTTFKKLFLVDLVFCSKVTEAGIAIVRTLPKIAIIRYYV